MKPILITSGEPAGIGPDVIIRIAQQAFDASFVVVGDPDLFRARAKQIGLPLTLIECDLNDATSYKLHQAGSLTIFPVKLNAKAMAQTLNVVNAEYVMRTLEIATAYCLKHETALVTAPLHKGIMNEAGIPFTGHTEFLAERAHVGHTVMLFVVDQLKVALATTHIPLAQVSKTLTKEHLHSVLKILSAGLNKYFKLSHPNILVCGLNPHAGEAGYLGREEIEVITPVLEAFREASLKGPLPADTIFIPESLKHADCVLAMYHDQALPLIKHIGFDRAVNVTLGLPFIRTSPDHGTALAIAGTESVDASSMMQAIKLAIHLSR